MRLLMIATALVLLSSAVLSSCDGGSGFGCPCSPCGFAITLNALDQNGDPVTGDWFVEASIDGENVDTSGCDPAVRNGLNTCSFGFQTGVYEVVVRSAVEEKELKARFAGRAGQNCCNCIPGETVDVVLEDT
jgi:hypothetical protein